MPYRHSAESALLLRVFYLIKLPSNAHHEPFRQRKLTVAILVPCISVETGVSSNSRVPLSFSHHERDQALPILHLLHIIQSPLFVDEFFLPDSDSCDQRDTHFATRKSALIHSEALHSTVKPSSTTNTAANPELQNGDVTCGLFTARLSTALTACALH